jgi:glutamine phosphoribosylpyrophosphate amidotransferase
MRLSPSNRSTDRLIDPSRLKKTTSTTTQGSLGIGHVRYPTAGSSSCAEAQPLFTNYPYGICAAHNGNLTNTQELRQALAQSLRHINTGSDSELLLNVFAEELQARGKHDIQPEDVFEAVRGVTARCKGAYGVVVGACFSIALGGCWSVALLRFCTWGGAICMLHVRVSIDPSTH